MKSFASSLMAVSLVIASAARADDVVQFPPDKALPDVLYFIGAESGVFNTNEFGDSYYPTGPGGGPAFPLISNPKPISYWQGITSAHSRWNSASGKSYFFHVEHGMHTPGTSDEKSEVSLPFSIGPGQDFYFGISILTETVSVSEWNLFFQLHSSMVLGSMVGLDTSPRDHGATPSALGVHYQSGDGKGLTCMGAAQVVCPIVTPALCPGGGVCPTSNAGGEDNQEFVKFADNNVGYWNDIILLVKMSSYTNDLRLKPDGMLQVWHRKAGGPWTDDPVVSKTKIVLGVTYTPKGMVADTYPRAGLYRDSWCQTLSKDVPCALKAGYAVPQPTEEIYLDNIVVARTLRGAQSVFPQTAAETGH
jgi:hypothetical protein